MVSKILMQRIFILIISVGLSVGQGMLGYYDDCLENEYVCAFNYQCCSKYCIGHRCGECKLMGEPCIYNSDCCNDKTCWLLHCNECREVGQVCLFDSDCCSDKLGTCTEKTGCKVKEIPLQEPNRPETVTIL